jgi:hypothetical protein
LGDFPDTILYPDSFNKSKAAGFDGVFDWSWTRGCFGDTNITPMDFDAVIERLFHYFVIETKDDGVPIPQGQLITLDNLIKPKDFTVMKCWGKEEPHRFIIRYPNGIEKEYYGVDKAREILMKWFQWASGIKEDRPMLFPWLGI